MNEKLRNKLFVMTSILCIIVILLPIWTGLGAVIYGFKQEEVWGLHTSTIETTPDPGDHVPVPDDVPQTIVTCAGTKIIQSMVKSKWEDTADDDTGWCYLEVDGVKRHFVALTPLFGLPGDYVDIVTVKDGVETVYPCIIVDAKDIWESFPGEKPYVHTDGKKYGHLYGDQCNIVEVILKGRDSVPQSIYDSFKGVVTEIVNGGSIEEYPDGPVGLDGSYGSSGGTMGELASLIGSVGAFFRDCWVLICTAFDNVTNGREDSSIFIYRYGADDGNVSSTVTGTNGDIIEACKLVTETFMSRNARYSLDEGLISGDIEKCYKEATRACCATYVSMVLYVSGRVKPEVINKYGYHATWNMAAMLTEAGAKRVYYPDIQPGDVVVHWPGNKGHVLIYAGDNQCWDQRSCCISTDGTVAATGTTVTKDAQYLSDSEIWRLP